MQARDNHAFNIHDKPQKIFKDLCPIAEVKTWHMALTASMTRMGGGE